MSGHHAWPPGKLHPDLQKGRVEVFRLGAWSIFSAGHGGVTRAKWDSFIFHCETWDEWRAIRPTMQRTWVKDQHVVSSETTPQQELVKRHCNTNMTGFWSTRCPECRKPIPDEILALWKLQNFDKIQEANGG